MYENKLKNLPLESSVQRVLSESRALLKMTMSVEYSMDQMLNFTEEKLKKFESANSLWTQNMKFTYKAFQAENPEPSAFLKEIGYYD